MSFVRPELLVALSRAREVVLGLALASAGGWLLWLGGYFFVPLGLVVVVISLSWAVLSWRRLQFGQVGDAPGVVEVDEGQIAYYGPQVGGSVGLPELVEIRLIMMRGRRLWRLKQADGLAILIPVEASGAERLFDAFAALPGMDTAGLIAALNPLGQSEGRALAVDAEMRLVWKRNGAGVVVR